MFAEESIDQSLLSVMTNVLSLCQLGSLIIITDQGSITPTSPYVIVQYFLNPVGRWPTVKIPLSSQKKCSAAKRFNLAFIDS